MAIEEDYGTVKEVYPTGVAVTSTNTKIFITCAKGDRIVRVGGKIQIAPKATQVTTQKAAKDANKKNKAIKDVKEPEEGTNPLNVLNEEDDSKDDNNSGGNNTPDIKE